MGRITKNTINCSNNSYGIFHLINHTTVYQVSK